MNYINYAYSENIQSSVPLNKTKLVYHLSSDDPWRVLLIYPILIQCSRWVTLMLSIEGVQLGVKNPHRN